VEVEKGRMNKKRKSCLMFKVESIEVGGNSWVAGEVQWARRCSSNRNLFPFDDESSN
jgi:hypothetical protein